MVENIRFSFGKNWENYLKGLTDQRIEIAKKSLQDFYKLNTLHGKSFLDIGCGSGLFSYAAFLLGADTVTSFDVDEFSVKCAKHLRDRAGNPKNWQIFQKSILEGAVLELGEFDIVYAWGVLHHTGNMWQAIDNAIKLVKKGGYFYLAIYNRIPGRLGSELWKKIKRFYVTASAPMQAIMRWLYAFRFIATNLIRLKNPFKKMREHQSKRGMDWFVDVHDWLGGYPYEYVTLGELFNYIKERNPDFDLMKLKSVQDYGNNWLVFRRH